MIAKVFFTNHAGRCAPLVAAAFTMTGLCLEALAEPGRLPARMQPVAVESGVLANPALRDATVFQQVIDLGADVPWARVLFDPEGTVLAPGSVIRVTSMLDGETHVLDAEEMEKWSYGTAFFNGSLIEVELIAGRNTAGNALRIREVFAGDPAELLAIAGAEDDDDVGGEVLTICGRDDDRKLTSHKAVGRLLSGGIQLQRNQDRICFRGDNDGGQCANDGDCPGGGTCVTPGTCFGGINSGMACVELCPSGTCFDKCCVGEVGVGNAGKMCNANNQCDSNNCGSCCLDRGDACVSVNPCPGSFCMPPVLLGVCTAFITDEQRDDPIHLTAGHCFQPGGRDFGGTWNQNQFTGVRVLQFLEGLGELSNPNCTIKHPPVDRQFVVRAATVISQDKGRGDDWGVFKCHRNTEGKTTYQKRDQVAFTLGQSPGQGPNVRVTGYGADGSNLTAGNMNNSCDFCPVVNDNGERNHALQTNAGKLVQEGPGQFRLNHQVDTCAGNSGSPILFRTMADEFPPEDSTDVIGIHTHGTCGADATGDAGANSGTEVTHNKLRDAISDLKGKKPTVIPTVSEWGLFALMLSLLAGAKVVYGRRRVSATG